jgi:LCP family protein required for cell wall assembly
MSPRFGIPNQFGIVRTPKCLTVRQQMSAFDSQLSSSRGRIRPKWRLLVRMLVGCIIVVAAVAGTIATGTLLEVKTFTDLLKQSPQLKLPGLLADAKPGAPQTLLLIGSDKRAKGAVDSSSPAHSDTMILVRLDPSQPETTMLSIPRDLKVTLHPDHARPTVQKFNAAYTLGGPKLTVKTIKQVLGISINHVIDINFLGFKELVNYLGCVFVQVDRRYYHSNLGLPAGATYDEINIQPGYQRLCGDNALHYVRYRHTDTDLVRAARQQDFLRQIKNQVGAGGLLSRRYGIEKIFGKYASTDIRKSDDVLKLLTLIVQSASHPVRQVVFNATLGPSYVTATSSQIRQTVHAFLNGGEKIGRVATGNAHGKRQKPASAPLSPATAEELALAHGLATSVPFKVYYPVQRVTTAAAAPDYTRYYNLNHHPAYVVVVGQGSLGQYYDLEGTTWTSPPILNNVNQTISLGGRTAHLYFEGQHIHLISWRDGAAIYWLTNTLQDVLTNKQMLAIAGAARPVG